MQEEAVVGEQEIGVVTHYWSHLGVAGVHLSGPLSVGDRIHIQGHTSDFEQDVHSIEIEHQAVRSAEAGQDVGIEVVEHVREHDRIYRVSKPQELGQSQNVL